MMRPLFYDYPDALKLDCDQALTFAVGRSLVVAAPARPESPRAQAICLPKGGWYDYWTGLPVSEHKLNITPKLDVIPLFVRAGTILPRQELVQSTMEVPQGPLGLDVYPGEDCRGELYFDDGVSVGGQNLRQAIRCTITPRGVVLHFDRRQGSWRPWWKKIAVTVHGPREMHMTIPDQPRSTEVTIQ